MSKFFADPGGKYKQGIQKLEGEISRINEENKRKFEEMEKAINKRDEIIEELKRERAEDKLKKSAYARLRIVFLLFIIIELVAIYLAGRFGEGANFLQRLKNLWLFPTIGFAVSIVASWFIIGKKRFGFLSWPLRKLLKRE